MLTGISGSKTVCRAATTLASITSGFTGVVSIVSSVETVSCPPSSAARRVCHGRVAHLTRMGNSRKPEKAARFPSSRRSSGARTSAVAQCGKTLERARRFCRRLPLHARGHHRRGGLGNRATQTLKADVSDHTIFQAQVEGELVAAERVVAFRGPVRPLQLLEVARPPIVVK